MMTLVFIEERTNKEKQEILLLPSGCIKMETVSEGQNSV